jgi:hypothetical protein
VSCADNDRVVAAQDMPVLVIIRNLSYSSHSAKTSEPIRASVWADFNWRLAEIGLARHGEVNSHRAVSGKSRTR